MRAGYAKAWRQLTSLPLGTRVLVASYFVLVMLGAPVAVLLLAWGSGAVRVLGLVLLGGVLVASFGSTIATAVIKSRRRKA